MNSFLKYGLLVISFCCLVQVDASCEMAIASDLYYNTDTYRWELVCPLPEHLFKLGESQLISDCRQCTCLAGGLQCCRVDEGAGVMSIPEECEVVSGDACQYQILKRVDGTPCF